MSLSEDHVHRYLLLALGVTAGALLFAREPSMPSGEAGDVAGVTGAAEEATRPALDAAVADLVTWIERSAPEPRNPLEANSRALALGRSALLPESAAPPSLAWQNLVQLASSTLPVGQATANEPTDPSGSRDGDALATLAILLETGIPLDRELPFASGPIPVRRLLELAVPRLEARRTSPDPWTLDLLSFAVLAGMGQLRAELTRSTVAVLARLDREQRHLTDLQGDGTPTAGTLDLLAAEFWRRRAAGEGGGRDLQLSAAAFRAVAVLADPGLEQRALRHLNALLFRYQLERDVYRRLLERAGPAQRLVVHAEAVEALGRLEQALYGANLAFQRPDRSGPAPRTAVSMRRAAGDLLEHLAALEDGSLFEAGSTALEGLEPGELLRAATHALRGLRAARVAT